MKCLVLFDIDGTLIQHSIFEAEIWLSAFKDLFGVDNLNDCWDSYKSNTDYGIFVEIFKNKIGILPTFEEVNTFRNLVSDKFSALLKQQFFLREVPGASAALLKLKNIDKSNLQFGIASGNWSSVAQIKLNTMEFSKNNSFNSYKDTYLSKEQLVSNTIEQFFMSHSKFEKIVYIGDTIKDFEISQKLGIGFIGICHNINNFEKLDLKYTFNDFLNFELFWESLMNV